MTTNIYGTATQLSRESVCSIRMQLLSGTLAKKFGAMTWVSVIRRKGAGHVYTFERRNLNRTIASAKPPTYARHNKDDINYIQLQRDIRSVSKWILHRCKSSAAENERLESYCRTTNVYNTYGMNTRSEIWNDVAP